MIPDMLQIAVVQLSLDIDFKSACGDAGKAKQFTDDFINHMAQMLGCDPSCIEVNGLSEGSVVVAFTIKTNPSNSSAPGMYIYICVCVNEYDIIQLYVTNICLFVYYLSLT
jgi:hypothetical protein